MSKNKGIFLVAQYFMKPRDHVNTSKAGWMSDPANIRWDEKVEFSRMLRTRDYNSQVILNLSQKTVVRNTFNPGKTFDEVFAYFFENYSKYLIPLMGQIDPAYLEGLAAELQSQIPPETMTDAEMKAAQAAQAEPQVVDVAYEEIKTE